MTPFNATRIRAIAAAFLFLFASAADAADWTLPQLLQLLAQNKSGRATFVEKKFIGIIDKPVLSSGELAFTAPDTLEKRTLKPKPETLWLAGDRLSMEQPGKPRLTVSLQDHPEIAAFVDSIRGTLAGDLAALEKSYRLELTGTAQEWLLVLVPKQARLLKIVSRLSISGANASLKTIAFEQGDGDHSEMVITNLAVQ